MKPNKPDIYFHVGLGKVASTFLQHRFFPKLKGICYIQRTKYRSAPKIIQNGKCKKYLVSREFDRQLPDEIAWFSRFFPDAKPILLLRRHDQWVVSQYKRYLKNGGNLELDAFFDLEQDKGEWKLHEVYFMPYIKALEQNFSNAPLVLFYEDFQAEPEGFLDKIADYIDATYDRASVDQRPSHTAYSDKQLKFIRKYGSRWFHRDKSSHRNPLLKWIGRRAEMLKSYAFLYAALLTPDYKLADEVLYPPEYLQKIREYYQSDWEACREYSSRNTFEGDFLDIND